MGEGNVTAAAVKHLHCCILVSVRDGSVLFIVAPLPPPLAAAFS